MTALDTWTFGYQIDADNVLVQRNDAFCDFARQNDAETLLNDLLGTPLSEHIHGENVWHIYDNILNKVRSTGEPLELPFRCDSPVIRRYMTMRVEPLADGGVQFWTRLDRTERFEQPVPLLDTITPRTKELLPMCAWCKAIRLADGQWVEIEDGVRVLGLFDEPTCPTVTHTVCPTCETKLMAELETADTLAAD